MGKEVLDIVDDEGLMENARLMGGALLDGLRRLQDDFDIIGDVRGYGLFIGLDLVRKQSQPQTGHADRRLRQKPDAREPDFNGVRRSV